jgi:hypothetical protein
MRVVCELCYGSKRPESTSDSAGTLVGLCEFSFRITGRVGSQPPSLNFLDESSLTFLNVHYTSSEHSKVQSETGKGEGMGF